MKYSDLFVFKGTPIIYAGSELGWAPDSVASPPQLYPFGDNRVFLKGSNLPMPWDLLGNGFSTHNDTASLYTKYLKDGNVTETVQVAKFYLF